MNKTYKILPRKVALVAIAALTITLIVSFISNDSASGSAYKLKSVEMNEGDGAKVRRLFPTRHKRHLDPFVLLDEFYVTPPAGFPEHPHRGFEAITYMIEGGFHHIDNLGNDDFIVQGEAQRFTAGSGMRHSEMPHGNGTSHGLQLWINLPRSKKQMAPSYQSVSPDEIAIDSTHETITRHVVGASEGIQLQTNVIYDDVTALQHVDRELTLAEGWNGYIYVLQGNVNVGSDIKGMAHEAIVLEGGHTFHITASAKSRWVEILGKAHNEPIKLNGPFVD